MLTKLSSSTKYQHWNNIGSSTLNWRNSFNVVSVLFCQHWHNDDKRKSAQLSFFNQILTLAQRWWTLTINVVSTLNQRCCVCWVIAWALVLGDRPFPNLLFHQVLLFRLYLRQYVNNLVIYPQKSKFEKFRANFSCNFTNFWPWLSRSNLCLTEVSYVWTCFHET